MRFEGKRTLVLGMGRSGSAAARLLAELGARVTVYDRDPARGDELAARIERVSGDAPPAFERFEWVVASPGFALAAGTVAMPEVDLAATQLRARLVGVTGTNGKSTTTELIGEMLRRSGVEVAIGGNLGTPLCELVHTPAAVVVAELSSFQLEHATRLHPQVGVLLNLAPDHLDRHGNVERYGRAKARLAELQREDDTLVCNLDDPWARSVPARGRRLGFSLERRLEQGAFLDGKDMVVRDADVEQVRLAREELGPGVRPYPANALAAALAALAAGASAAGLRDALEHFEGLPHRGRLVCVRRGVRYVDDSKATNPAAARASVLAQTGPVVWLAGGRNKGLPFDALLEATGRARVVVVYGEAANQIEAALRGHVELARAPGLEQALERAAACARAGETVLLAPACASFDEFSSFEARGDRFAALARRLPGEQAAR
jgi:UDP-N-acetylmuramoylalanine--D-glutamate ligase